MTTSSTSATSSTAATSATSTPSSSVSGFSLADLPRVPRPLSAVFAFTVLFSGTAVFSLTGMAVASAVGTTLYANGIDARDHEHDPARGMAKVVDIELVRNKKRKERIDRSVVTARADDGRVVVSYFADEPLFDVGAAVSIRGDDAHLVIDGGRLRPYGRFELLPLQLINGVLGVVFALVVLARVRLLHALRSGHATTARVLSRREHTKNGQTTTELTYVFEDADGRSRTHRVLASQAIGDESEEPVLCTPFFVAMLDALPGAPRIEGGRFVMRASQGIGTSVLAVLALVAFPVLVAVAQTLALR